MAKFECFKDLFSFNRCLMEDDFNDGQLYTVKLKNKTKGGQEFATTVKVGNAKDGSHKLAFEEKVKGSHTELGGFKFEGKIKNSGDVESEAKFNWLKNIEGLEDLKPMVLYKLNTSSGFKGADVGFEFENKSVKTKNLVSASSTPVLDHELTVQTGYDVIVGEQHTVQLTDPAKDLKG